MRGGLQSDIESYESGQNGGGTVKNFYTEQKERNVDPAQRMRHSNTGG